MTNSLYERLGASGNMPTPPGVVLKLLELSRQEDVSSRQIADTLAQDPALTAKILRFANSPMAGIPREVTSVQRAVGMIGARGVKMMALSFAVLGSRNGEECQGFDTRQFNLQSIGCGVAAKLLAEETKGVLGQDAFLAGLLSQIGRSALAACLPVEYAKILPQADHIPQDLPALELRQWGECYPQVGAYLLRSWRIPETLCTAIEHFRDIKPGQDVDSLTALLHVAERAAAVVCPDGKGDAPDSHEFVEAASEWLNIQPDRCADLMNRIAQEIEATRDTLEIPQGRTRAPEEIQTEVRERIAELSMAMHIENQTMQHQQEDLLRRATTDALTGIGNRAAFDARLELELERFTRTGESLALIIMDADRFKSINDTHGHPAGDRILQTVANTVDRNIRKVDYAARYGGEEFAVIAPNATGRGAADLAERLRHAVAEETVAWEGKQLSVTISLGVAVLTHAQSECTPAELIKAADAQLYKAKCGGRDRVEIVVDGEPFVPELTTT